MSATMLCELHDYIEIACVFRYPIKLLLDTKEALIGTAVNTKTQPDKTECLIFIDDKTHEKRSIAMNSLVEMTALVSNKHFETVRFKQN